MFTGLWLKTVQKMQTNVTGLKGNIVEFNVENGVGRGYLSVPKTSRGGVMVLHAWWGLNDFFKGFCDRLASEGYTALAPDLRQGKVAKTVDEAKRLMSEIDELATFPNIVLGGFDRLRSEPSMKGQRLGVVGFSMGASWALWLSAQRPSDVKAVVVFYGAFAEPSWDFSKNQSSYLGHFSPEDEWEPVEGVHSLEDKIRKAHRPVTFHFYPGAKHWFIEDNQPAAYNRGAAQLAWTRTLDFLKATL
jgi:carboxymethylenebutenolidase